MSATIEQPEQNARSPVASPKRRRGRRTTVGVSMLAQGEPMVWLTGAALAICLVMIVGLLGTVIWLGMRTFIPQPVVQLQHKDGYFIAGEVTRDELFSVRADLLLGQSPQVIGDFTAQLFEQLGGDAMVQERLPSWIEATQQLTREQIAESEQKSALIVARIERNETDMQRRIEGLATHADRVQDRLTRIEASVESDKQVDLRAELESLRSKIGSERRQLTNADEAVAYLAATDEISAADEGQAWLTEAPRHVRVVVLNAMLAERAEQLGERTYQSRRRLVRIGNKELSGTTYRWVMDLEIEPEQTTLPEWSLVVERQEWGRFFGQPRRFVVREPRSPGTEEDQFGAMLRLFELQQHRLEDDVREAINVPLASLREEFVALRSRNIERFVAQVKEGATSDEELLAVSRDGATVPLVDLPADADLAEVRRVWGGPEAAWGKFVDSHADTLARSAERHQLMKYDVGHVSRLREDARLMLRRQELKIEHERRPIYREREQVKSEIRSLRSDEGGESSARLVELRERLKELSTQAREIEERAINLVGVATEIRQYEARRDAITERIAEHDSLLDSIRMKFGAESAIGRAAEAIVTELNEESLRERTQPEAKLGELRRTLANAPLAAQAAAAEFFVIQRTADEYAAFIQGQIDRLTEENERRELHVVTADQHEQSLVVDDVVRAYPANKVAFTEKAGVYASRWWEFLTADPREANSEGGVFPAIWGTVIMTLIMSLAVAPFGVLAALYLREYAKTGPVVSAVRISINNLAGVPSIVFGVFGFGFFCHVVGGYVDGGPDNTLIGAMPAPRWYLFLATLAIVALIAFVCGIGGKVAHPSQQTTLKTCLSRGALLLWLLATGLFVVVIATSPFFSGFYEAELPTPTFKKGGVLWASLTLSMLTLPVVIVATEEALAAVPNSMREGSYGCGASKWQTIRRIVLPHAMPGVMTGLILAMARGAGEVAPLMLVGALKLAPELPVHLADWSGSIGPLPTGPLHADRSFMHLGFHIFDLGFQSQDSEAAKPMVFTTTLLLIGIIATLNIGAIWLRNRLRRRFNSGQF